MPIIPTDIKAKLVDIFDVERDDFIAHEAIDGSLFFARVNHFKVDPGFLTEPPDHRSGYYD